MTKFQRVIGELYAVIAAVGSIADGFKIRFLGCRDRLRNGLFKPARKLGVPEVRGISVAIIHRYRRKVIFHHTIDECIIDEQATEMMFRLVEQMADKEGVTEQLKVENPMLWVGRMNEIQARAREIVYANIIYK